MPLLLRLLGLGSVARAGSELPPGLPRVVSSVLLVVANLVPVWGVLHGDLGVGDVFVLYWIENVAVWLVTIVKIATAQAPEDPTKVTMTMNGRRVAPDPRVMAGFFAFHYGLFTLVHGVFAFVLAFTTGGFTGSAGFWVLSVLVLVWSHALSLALHWFGRDERARATPSRTMLLPYPRMVVLHLSVIGAFFLLGGPDGRPAEAIGPVVLLCGLKTLVDLGFHLREHRSTPPVDPVALQPRPGPDQR